MRQERLIAGLDVGSGHICAVIGNIDPEDRVDVLGIDSVSTRGMRQGRVVDSCRLSESIEQVVGSAEEKAKCRFHSVFVGTSAAEMKTRYRRGMAVISSPERRIRRCDIEKVTRCARTDSLCLDESILGIVPQGYTIDDQEDVKNPLGMFGTRLAVGLLQISAPAATVENLSNCINQIGLEVEDVIPSGLASAYSALTEGEKNEGAVLLDVGAETTQVIVFTEGTTRVIEILPRGANYITNAMKERNRAGGIRMKEILEEVKKILEKYSYLNSTVSNLVITGGGSLLEGMAELAENHFNLPVRTGIAHRVRGGDEIVTSPVSAAAIGLIRYGAVHRLRKRNRRQKMFLFNRVINRLQELVEEYF